MTSGRQTLLLAGASTRAMAESAARCGWRVLACDGFGDLDQREVTDALWLAQPPGRVYRAADLVRTVERQAGAAAAGAVAYVSNFENHPDLVARLARGRELLGNPPGVLRQARDPLRLASLLRRAGLPAPRVRASRPSRADGIDWLSKRRRSGGGRGVVPWRGRGPLPRSRYLQERIRGLPCSLSFVADGRRIRPFAWSHQLIGERAFGIGGFGYAGNILCTPGDPGAPGSAAALPLALRIAEACTRAFGLVGVNGLDFVIRRGVPFPVELNPRYSASMELAERAGGISVFGLHLAGCRGRLGTVVPFPPPPGLAYGKAVVYARASVALGDTRRWLLDSSLRDVPAPGERIGAGHPICTVFATGRDSTACHAALVRRARRLYQETSRMNRAVA